MLGEDRQLLRLARGQIDAVFLHFDELSDVHFKGAFFTVQRALPHMRDGGSVILVSSSPAQSQGVPMTSVYNPNPFVWSEPVTASFAQPFSVPKGGGFDFTCTWNNTGTTAVKFGESANDEIMLVPNRRRTCMRPARKASVMRAIWLGM